MVGSEGRAQPGTFGNQRRLLTLKLLHRGRCRLCRTAQAGCIRDDGASGRRACAVGACRCRLCGNLVHVRQIFIRPQTERHSRIPAELREFGLGISCCLFTIRPLGKQRLQQLFPLLGSTARSHLCDRFGILIGNPCGKLGRFCRNGDFDKIGTRLARDGQGAQKRIYRLMHLRRFFFRKFSNLRTEIRIAEKI